MSGYAQKKKSDEWETPDWLFKLLDSEFSFTLDCCASSDNTKCARYYTVEDNALTRSWAGASVFMNPPYGVGIGLWTEKALFETSKHDPARVVVGLLPVRTENRYFYRDILGRAEIRFIEKRLKFSNRVLGLSGDSATFPSMVIIWKKGIKPNCRPFFI